MSLIKQLNWRYAAKQMNGEKVAAEKVETIIESIRLAPTSMGLQPFKLLIVSNQELKNRIFDIAAPGQPQIPNCSELLIFAAFKKITTEVLDDYFHNIKTTRQALPEEKVKAYRAMMESVVSQGDDANFEWAVKQTYIALGFGLVAAAHESVDSVPIEGFSKKKLDELLGLHDKNLSSTCLMAIGYRNPETDWNSKMPKVRKSKADFVEYLD